MRAPRFNPGFTLIELLLVVALLLAAGALVYPAMLGRMGERAFESAAEVVVNQLLLARAYARTENEPIEILYLPEPARVLARRFEPAGPPLDESEPIRTFDGPAEDTEPAAGLASEAATSGLLIPEDWAIRPLPHEFWIDARSPDENALSRVPRRSRVLSVEDRGRRPLRLCVFLPDGSALASEAVFLGDAERSGRLSVNPWTGLPTFERLEGDEETADADADEPPPEDDEEPGDLEDFRTEAPAPAPEPEPAGGAPESAEPAEDEPGAQETAEDSEPMEP